MNPESAKQVDHQLEDPGGHHIDGRGNVESLGPYPYEPLSEDCSNIRVLTIQPGDFEDDVRIHLTTIALEAEHENKHPYEALSYTWGGTEDPAEIYVQNSLGFWSIAVTQNCATALRYLRHKDRPRTMWIDAICINQNDLDERARQVSKMRSVYGKSSLVIVWLGPASQDSDLAIGWINTVANEIMYDSTTGQIRPIREDARWADLTHTVASETELDAFANILERSYFDRLWVWQEVRMGADLVKLRCGYTETAFEKLMTAVRYFAVGQHTISPAVWRLVPRADFILSLPLQGQNNSLFVLDRVRGCQCSDPRDRVYISFAFGNSYQQLDVAPDYRRSVQYVYVDFVLRYLDVCQDLDILMFVGDDLPHERSAVIEGLPSFVPDWSRRSKVWRFYLGFCSGNSKASVISASSDCLAVRGVRSGSIQRAVQFGCDAIAAATSEDVQRACCQTLGTLLPEGIDETSRHQLIRVLTSDIYAEHYVPAKLGYATWDQCEQYLWHVLSGAAADTMTADHFQAQRSFQYIKGRSLFLTDTGKIGLGPQALQDGDILAVLLGCRTLTVLRPSINEPGHYNIIGPALCAGLMDGESVLGPLPEQYETVQIFTEATRSSGSGFRNKLTGEVTLEDPRLPPLSSEWKDVKEEKYPSYPGSVYEHIRTGETRSGTLDPRLDADALASRGVELQEFYIV